MIEAGDANVVTIAALAEKLGVPVADVAKAALSLGLTNTMTQPLTAEDAALVEQLVRLDGADRTIAQGTFPEHSRGRDLVLLLWPQ